MAGTSSQTATSCFVLALALSTLLLVTSCSCSETAVPAAPPSAETQPSKAKPAPDRARVAPTAETLANDSEQDQPVVDRDAGQSPARVAQRSERKRLVDEEEPEQWEDEAEYEEEYEAESKDERDARLRSEKVERQRRRQEARDARDERRLAHGLPVGVQGHDPGSQGEEPSREQLEQDDPNGKPARQRPFEAALNDENLSDETKEEVKDLPKERRRWEVRNRLKLDALRTEVKDAKLVGDTLAAQEAQDRLNLLTATKPTLGGILSGSTDKGPTS